MSPPRQPRLAQSVGLPHTPSSGCRSMVGSGAAGNIILCRWLIVIMTSKGGGPGALSVGTRALRRTPYSGDSESAFVWLSGRGITGLPSSQRRGGLEGRMAGVLDGGRYLRPALQSKTHSRRQGKAEVSPSESHRGRRCLPTILAARTPSNDFNNGGMPPMQAAETAEELV